MRITLKECADIIGKYRSFLILTHASPDGDTLGSAFALKRALQKIGKPSKVVCNDEIPQKYSFLWDGIDNDGEDFEAVIAVDIADRKLLGENINSEYGDRIVLAIDHHLSHRDYAENTFLCDKASNAENIYALVNEMNIDIDAGIATCIYCGMATDTGCFLFTNTTAETHKTAAVLMEKGADFAIVNRKMFETKTASYLKLEQMALGTIELHFGGKCAIMHITQDMFRESNSNEGECDGIASLPRKIEGVLIGITIREKENGSYKVSIRTVEPYDAAEICAHFGGGGHNRAAGCEFECSLEETKSALLGLI
ncbi:MAG: bifunctional oligoribonuclease/PAP phosphatase NrnA, partial [Oscillospiraceae bacterium]|nr:bifunctional oligoribonuclease/PAP phosphatase NrnA [Oscillospiraceae bacterium]